MSNIANFFKNKFKILIIIVVALGLTLILSQTLFGRNTLLINPDFILKARKSIEKITDWSSKFFASKGIKDNKKQPLITNVPKSSTNLPTIFPNNPIDQDLLAKDSFQPTDKGVSTGTDTTTGNKYVKIEAGTVVEVQEYTLVDGRHIQVIKPIN